METITLQINNLKAYKLLEDLEDLNLIKVISRESRSSENLSDKYFGVIPKEVAKEMQDFVTESRNEWQSRDI